MSWQIYYDYLNPYEPPYYDPELEEEDENTEH
jgi:hypothetical protein